MSPVSSDVVKEFAPTGTLRAAINQGNTVLAQKGANGEALGITVDLARELGKRLGVPVELVTFDAAGKAFEALKRGVWDIAFLAIEPVRAAEVDFTAPYVLIEGTYMVPKDSTLKAIADVDRAGVRIGVNRLGLRSLSHAHAQERHARSRPDRAGGARHVHARQARGRGRREAAAGGIMPPTDPSVRVMDGRFMAIQQAMGMPKGRANGARLPAQLRRGDEGVRLLSPTRSSAATSPTPRSRRKAEGRLSFFLAERWRRTGAAAAAVGRLVAGHRLVAAFRLRLLLFLGLLLLSLGHDRSSNI